MNVCKRKKDWKDTSQNVGNVISEMCTCSLFSPYASVLNLGLSYDKHVFLLSEDTRVLVAGYFFKTIHDTAVSKRQVQVHSWSIHPRPVLLDYMGTPTKLFLGQLLCLGEPLDFGQLSSLGK